MREYGKIHSSFWTSSDIRALGEDGRTLAAYLLTSPHSNMLGCFRVPLAYVCDDLKWPLERVLEGFSKLTQRVWATFDKGSEWVVIHKFLKWNQPENPNVVRAAEKLFAQIPSSSGVKSILAWAIAEFEPRFSVDKLSDSKPFANPFDTILKAYRKPEPEPEPEPLPEPEPKSKPPIPPLQGGKVDGESKKRSTIALKTFLEQCKAKGEKPIPEGDSVFDYASKAGIPEDYLRLHWFEFKARYGEEGAKRYKDWRSVFRKSVRGNWFKLWWLAADGTCSLTTVGEQAKRLHGRDAA